LGLADEIERARSVHRGGDVRLAIDLYRQVLAQHPNVSVDTSVAHLAAALGKAVWILLSYSPDFRWLLNRSDSPWYPTATLIRQAAPGDWGSVIPVVAERLRHRDATNR
jgi:ADP-heptose:LPS heptosyltransferase